MLNLHLSPRIQHLLTGLIILALSNIIPLYPIGSVLLFAATLAFYLVHSRRIHNREYNVKYLKRFGGLLREEERGEWTLLDDVNHHKNNQSGITDNKKKYQRKSHPILPGAFHFLLGTAIASALFPPQIAKTCLLVLSVSDPTTDFVGVWFTNVNCNNTWGRLWGIIQQIDGEREMAKGPTVMGSLACGLSTLLCTYVYFPDANEAYPMMNMSSRIVGVVVAIVEAVAGRCMILLVDDNLLIPLVVGGLIMWLTDA